MFGVEGWCLGLGWCLYCPLTPDPSPPFHGGEGGFFGVQCSVGEPRTGVRGCGAWLMVSGEAARGFMDGGLAGGREGGRMSLFAVA